MSIVKIEYGLVVEARTKNAIHLSIFLKLKESLVISLNQPFCLWAKSVVVQHW
jgi:hypothetical protein